MPPRVKVARYWATQRVGVFDVNVVIAIENGRRIEFLHSCLLGSRLGGIATDICLATDPADAAWFKTKNDAEGNRRGAAAHRRPGDSIQDLTSRLRKKWHHAR